MMKVVGEEGTSLEDYIHYLKSEFLDDVYLQQNSFDPVDSSVSVERQRHIFDILFSVLGGIFDLHSKEEARTYFNELRQLFLDYNGNEWQNDEFKRLEKELKEKIASKRTGTEPKAARVLENLEHTE